jgi:hypothetical protein
MKGENLKVADRATNDIPSPSLVHSRYAAAAVILGLVRLSQGFRSGCGVVAQCILGLAGPWPQSAYFPRVLQDSKTIGLRLVDEEAHRKINAKEIRHSIIS